MVELLLRKGANPDIPSYAGTTCAMAAQGRNLHGVLKLLGSVATDYVMGYETKMQVLSAEVSFSQIIFLGGFIGFIFFIIFFHLFPFLFIGQ